jgi:hypothetical protein
VVDRIAARPSLDLLVALAITAAYFLTIHFRAPQLNLLAFAEASQRLAVYAAGAGLASLIAGFSGTAIAQYGSSSGPVVEALRQVHGYEIRKNWLSIVRWLLVAAVLCIIAMVIDTKTSPRYSDYLFYIALSVAVLKFFRLTLLFRLVLAAVDSQSQPASQGKTAPYPVKPRRTSNPEVVDHG